MTTLVLLVHGSVPAHLAATSAPFPSLLSLLLLKKLLLASVGEPDNCLAKQELTDLVRGEDACVSTTASLCRTSLLQLVYNSTLVLLREET